MSAEDEMLVTLSLVCAQSAGELGRGEGREDWGVLGLEDDARWGREMTVCEEAS